MPLDWWPLTRDCLAYGVTVSLMICIIHDERVEWYEALTLVLLYIVYTAGNPRRMVLAEPSSITKWFRRSKAILNRSSCESARLQTAVLVSRVGFEVFPESALKSTIFWVVISWRYSPEYRIFQASYVAFGVDNKFYLTVRH